MNFFTFSAVLAVIIVTCESFRLNSIAENNVEGLIVNGETAKRDQFPFMVSLSVPGTASREPGWIHECGGSLLSDRWILSAFYCTRNSMLSQLVIVVGAHQINDGKAYYLDQIVNHPESTFPMGRNDISLLRTSETIKFNNFVRPIRLSKAFVGVGVRSIVSGWGFVRKVRMKFNGIQTKFVFVEHHEQWFSNTKYIIHTLHIYILSRLIFR